MKNTKKLQWAFFLSGVTDVFILDFVTKLLVVREAIGEFVFIKDFFYLTSAYKNDGIAFGIDLPMGLQIAGSMLILILLVKFGFEQMPRTKVSLIFGNMLLGGVIGGGLGNLVDRIMHGYVVDFIVLRPFPVFNIADVGITVGLFALFATMVLSPKDSENKI